MDNQVLKALIDVAGIVLSGIISAVLSIQLIKYRIEQLEKKVDKHNNLIDRTYQLEKEVAILKEEIN